MKVWALTNYWWANDEVELFLTREALDRALELLEEDEDMSEYNEFEVEVKE